MRINPVRFAQQRGFTTGTVVDLFLHARKIGLLTMEWQYVCPGCGEIVERLASLTSATAHYFCQVCSADRDADLSDFIEVTPARAAKVSGQTSTPARSRSSSRTQQTSGMHS